MTEPKAPSSLDYGGKPETIVVAGEPSYWGEYIFPARRLTLPFAVNAKIGSETWASLFLVFVFLVDGFALLVAASAGTMLSATLMVLCSTFCISVGLWLLGFVVMTVWDGTSSQPQLILTSEGLIDRRLSDQLVPWTSIAEADARPNLKFFVIRLKLRQPLELRHNYLRFSLRAWPVYAQRGSDQIFVSLSELTYPRRELANAIRLMVKRHGGLAILGDAATDRLEPSLNSD